MNPGTLVLQILSSLSSVCVLLSPSPALYRVHKSQKIENLSVVPLASMLMSAHVWMLYGYLSDDIFPLCVTYLFGDFCALTYLAIYFKYTDNRKRVVKIAGGAIAVLLVVTLYVILGLSDVIGDKHSTETAMGWVGDVVSLILYTSPFETMVTVVRTKNAISIPIYLVVAGTISNALWVAYAAVIGDMFVLVINVICVAVGSSQTILYMVYHPKKALAKYDQGLPIAIASPVNGESAQWIAIQSPEVHANPPTLASIGQV